MGLVATMTALVLGMLVASAKASFDAQRQGVAQLAANAIVLDRFLAYYGEEAGPTRELLRDSVADVLRRSWPEGDPAEGRSGAGVQTEGRYDARYVPTVALRPRTDIRSEGRYDELYVQTLALRPSTDAQRASRPRPSRSSAIPGRCVGSYSPRSGAPRSRPRCWWSWWPG